MKKLSTTILIAITLCSCSQDENSSAGQPIVEVAESIITADDVRTQKELDLYLKQKYGDVQPLASLWQGSRDSGSGDYRYRLPDGKEIAIPGIYTRSMGNIIDPEFDLQSLPD